MTRTQGLDGGGSIAADAMGHVYVAWHGQARGSTGEANRRMWVARSKDDGATFSRRGTRLDQLDRRLRLLRHRGAGRLQGVGLSPLPGGDRRDRTGDGLAQLSRQGSEHSGIGKPRLLAVQRLPDEHDLARRRALEGSWPPGRPEGQVSFARIDRETGERTRATTPPGEPGSRKHPAPGGQRVEAKSSSPGRRRPPGRREGRSPGRSSTSPAVLSACPGGSRAGCRSGAWRPSSPAPTAVSRSSVERGSPPPFPSTRPDHDEARRAAVLRGRRLGEPPGLPPGLAGLALEIAPLASSLADRIAMSRGLARPRAGGRAPSGRNRGNTSTASSRLEPHDGHDALRPSPGPGQGVRPSPISKVGRGQAVDDVPLVEGRRACPAAWRPPRPARRPPRARPRGRPPAPAWRPVRLERRPKPWASAARGRRPWPIEEARRARTPRAGPPASTPPPTDNVTTTSNARSQGESQPSASRLASRSVVSSRSRPIAEASSAGDCQATGALTKASRAAGPPPTIPA